MTIAPWLGTPPLVLVILLFTGHVLGDFLLQTRRMVQKKGRPGVLALHSAMVLFAHGLAVLPFVRQTPGDVLAALTLLMLLALLHAFVDRVKIRAREQRGADSVRLFIADQAAHAGVIVAVWVLWQRWPGIAFEPVPGPGSNGLGLVAASALVATAYVLNGSCAATLIKLFLDRFPVGGQTQTAGGPLEIDFRDMGRTIGILERMLLLSFILLGQWQAVGWIFAGKTVARFRELDNRNFSEYYLIGTLSSLLFAAATGSAVRLAVTGTL